MTTVPKRHLTPEEYLAKERKAEFKSEYYDGEMFAMSGASREHNLIAGNVNGEARNQLRDRPCEVYQSDMRVKVSRTGLYTYPDVVIVCGEPRFEDAEVDTLLNPTVVFEVLSKSTEGYDRGTKSEHYRRIPSLREYVLIAQDRCHVERFSRQPDNRWLLWESEDLEAILDLPSVGCEMKLSDIYAKVELGETVRTEERSRP
ncbi:MAG: Uma2 family endonuclease [Pirellulales bacterium]|nr:Uma2 family endonuclease [Pirellulales bacterium]